MYCFTTKEPELASETSGLMQSRQDPGGTDLNILNSKTDQTEVSRNRSVDVVGYRLSHFYLMRTYNLN